MRKIIVKLKNDSLFTFILGVLLCSGIVYGVNNYQSNEVEYSPTDTSWEVSNVNEAINSLYSNVKELDNIKSIGDATASDIASGKTALVQGELITGTAENKTYSNNWTMVVSFDISLGWNGTHGYGSRKGQLTIKSVDGNVSITQSGGDISSPTENWNGNYYINAKTGNFKIESFTFN